jgi:signal peptidase II
VSRNPGYGRALLVAVVALALDQLSKALVRGGLGPGDRVDLLAGIDLVRVSNRGIAFGLLDDAGSLVIVLAAGAFAALLVVFLSASERRGLWLPIGLLAGGAAGNLIDRIHEGAVTDFIDLGPWPAFNLADVEITLGVVILVWMYAFGTGAEADPGDEGRDEAKAPARAGPESG